MVIGEGASPEERKCGAGKTVKSSLLGHFSNFPRSNFLAWKMEMHALSWRLLLQRVKEDGTSLMVRLFRIHLPMLGAWVRSPVQEDSTCCGAAKSMPHNY